MLTMILGGLWHGAAWTFVLWGIYQGLLAGRPPRSLEPWLERIQPDRPGRPRLLEGPADRRRRSTWSASAGCSSAPIGRAGRRHALGDRQPARRSRRRPTSSRSWSWSSRCWLVQFVQYLADDLDVIARTPWYVRSAFYTACFYAIVLGGEFGGQQFIYFQF